NIPTSTLQSNIWYHLGLAYFLQGDFKNALVAYRECLKVSRNDDMLCATTDWLVMTCWRLGLREEADRALASIHREMTILENTAYHRRLLLYKGELPVDSLLRVEALDDLTVATQGFGVAHWYLVNGDSTRATAIFGRITGGTHWAAFGFIAAEAELLRLQQ
ncbi:MAG: tetratricopeptide repeat protein, partial [Bacteroidota bacterium]